jgi:hypothetical protein
MRSVFHGARLVQVLLLPALAGLGSACNRGASRTLRQDDGVSDSRPLVDAVDLTRGDRVTAGSGMMLVNYPDRGAGHVEEGTELEFEDNPPASGDHYGVWARFEAYTEPVPRGYWVHNLEHGGVVLLYGPSAGEELQQQLRKLYEDLPEDPKCGHSRALLSPDPELAMPIAAVAWQWVLYGDVVAPDAILQFVEEHRGQAPEDICSHGVYYQ